MVPLLKKYPGNLYSQKLAVSSPVRMMQRRRARRNGKMSRQIVNIEADVVAKADRRADVRLGQRSSLTVDD